MKEQIFLEEQQSLHRRRHEVAGIGLCLNWPGFYVFFESVWTGFAVFFSLIGLVLLSFFFCSG